MILKLPKYGLAWEKKADHFTPEKKMVKKIKKVCI